METVYKILEANPILTLLFGFIIAVLAMILFREEIKAYIKKKYHLMTEEEVISELQKHHSDAEVLKLTKLIFKKKKLTI